MPDTSRFLLCLLVMAGVTYLIRMLPLTLIQRKIQNRYLRSFLGYVPYACLSAITPPVCVAVFMASGLAKSNWFKTGILACMVALPIFIIPYTFTYNSSLLMDGSLFNIIFAAITGLVGVVLINFCTVGYIRSKINWFIRIGCIVGGILMLFPDVVPSLIGLAIGAVFFLIGYRQPAKAAKSAE